MTDDIDPERKFSNGSDWDNSIDWDDSSDGSDGGYTRNGNYINSDAMKELIKLRIDSYNKDKRIEELEKVLEFYADDNNYNSVIIDGNVQEGIGFRDNYGDRARRILQK